jgi:hypothetical protein
MGMLELLRADEIAGIEGVGKAVARLLPESVTTDKVRSCFSDLPNN